MLALASLFLSESEGSESQRKEELLNLVIWCHMRPDPTFGSGGTGDQSVPQGHEGGTRVALPTRRVCFWGLLWVATEVHYQDGVTYCRDVYLCLWAGAVRAAEVRSALIASPPLPGRPGVGEGGRIRDGGRVLHRALSLLSPWTLPGRDPC